ncbi:MAG: hypothetical protein CMF41_02625 [Legionellales bacterium]|nr:hypothetical protein [Legionellales bacterium]OUX65641.1 MAG: hypothetical protein CBE41_01385 [Gammaproteobacteria bacterium TMED281]
MMQSVAPHQTLKQNYVMLLLLLLPWATMFAACLDLYLPAIPKLATIFQVPVEQMLHTQSFFVLTLGLSMLIVGPLTDIFGQKKIVIASLCVLIIGHINALFAENYLTLLYARIIEALGCSGILLIAYAYARQTYNDPNKTTGIIGTLNASIGLCWITLPATGTFLIAHYEWQSIFAILTVASLVSLLFTLHYFSQFNDDNITHDQFNIHSLKTFFRHPNTYFYGLGCAVTQSTCFIFTSQAPTILLDHLHVSLTHFSIDFAVVALCFSFTNLYCSQMLQHLTVREVVMWSNSLIFIGGLIMLLCYEAFGITHAGFLIPMIVIIMGAGLMCSSALWGAIREFKTNTATILAILGAVRFSFSALTGFCSSIIGLSISSVGIITTVLASLMILSDLYYKKKITQ